MDVLAPDQPSKVVICTLITKRDLAKARILLGTIAQAYPQAGRVALLLDDCRGYFDPQTENFTIWDASALGLSDWAHFRFKYAAAELKAALKPLFLLALFEAGAEKLIFLDVEQRPPQGLDEMLSLLDGHQGVLVPQAAQPSELVQEVAYLQGGAYQAGLIGLARRGAWRELLAWWAEKVRHDCIQQAAKGLNLDQHWLDLLPSLFDGLHIWRGGAVLPPLMDAETYQAALIGAGQEIAQAWPYEHDFFPDGLPIPYALRACLRRYDRFGKAWPDPYKLELKTPFRAWASAIQPQDMTRYLSPYALMLHSLSDPYQANFPDVRGADERAYAEYLLAHLDHEGMNPELHPVYLAGVAASLSKKAVQVAERTPKPSFFWQRIRQTARYYREYPQKVKPYLPPNIMDNAPEVYTGPDGLYKTLRQGLMRLGVQRSLRQLIGLRVILSTRYFFTYPSHEAQVLALSQAAETQADHVIQQGVNIIGYMYSETGVGQAARNVLGALEALNYPIATLPIETYDPSRKGDKFAERFRQGVYYPINIFHINADMTFPIYNLLGRAAYQDRYNIGFWFWETARFPQQWQQSFEPYNEIWVGSSFVQASIAAESPIPVVKIPLPTEVELPEASQRSDFGLPPNRFCFVFVFDALSVIERKNPWGLIAAYEAAFSVAERQNDVLLVIKTTNLNHFPDQARRLRAEVARVGGVLLESYFDRLQTNALMNACDAYVSLHRSEGYGLTMAEAMVLGKPVIATAYSGNMDFMTPDNSYLVPYTALTLEQDHLPYRAGDTWAEPDLAAAADLMRYVFEQRAEALARGEIAAAYMRRERSLAACGAAIAARLSEIYGALERDRAGG